MHKSVIQILRIILHRRKPDIRLVPKPHLQWIPRRHQHPLPDVEFPVQNDLRVLYVFLSNPVPLFIAVVDDFNKGVVDIDASASGHACWFDNPDVVVTVDFVLWVDFFQSHEDSLCSFFESFLLLIFFIISFCFLVLESLLCPSQPLFVQHFLLFWVYVQSRCLAVHLFHPF